MQTNSGQEDGTDRHRNVSEPLEPDRSHHLEQVIHAGGDIGPTVFVEGEAQAQPKQFSIRKFGYGSGRGVLLVQHQPDCTG